jgi:hypothetical protein
LRVALRINDFNDSVIDDQRFDVGDLLGILRPRAAGLVQQPPAFSEGTRWVRWIRALIDVSPPVPRATP